MWSRTAPDSRQIQRLIAALGIAMPLATNWQASEKAAYYQRFLFSLDPRFHDESAQSSPATKVHSEARSASLCLFSSNTPFRRDSGGSVRQSKRLLRH
jgi:hypothetical protein